MLKRVFTQGIIEKIFDEKAVIEIQINTDEFAHLYILPPVLQIIYQVINRAFFIITQLCTAYKELQGY